MGGKGKEPAGPTPISAEANPYLLRELSVPCVYYCPEYLTPKEADDALAELRLLRWALNGKTARHTTLYGDPSSNYHYKRGYASSEIHPWTPLLLDLKRRAEQWYFRITGRVANFNVCLGNKYDHGGQSLGWHSDREEIDPELGGPRLTPICSISLGAERLFGFHSKLPGAPEEAAVRLQHGSLVVMDNICQLLYRHSLLPDDSRGMRINLTFRQKAAVAAPAADRLRQEAALFDAFRRRFVVPTAEPGAVVTATPATAFHARDSGFKETIALYDTPFAVGVHGPPEQTVSKYYRWLLAQPATCQLLRARLAGKKLVCDCPPGVPCHAGVLATIANAEHDLLEDLPRPTSLHCQKDSQFLAFVVPAASPDEVALRIDAIRSSYPDAQHYAYAYRLAGPPAAALSEDDGEPRRSAGPVILRNIERSGRQDVLVLVVRYFGGTLLGVHNLSAAYDRVTADALQLPAAPAPDPPDAPGAALAGLSLADAPAEAPAAPAPARQKARRSRLQ